MPAASDVLAASENYRTEQARRSALIAAIVARFWLTQVKADDPASLERWLAAVIPVIVKGRGVSAVLAATYGAAMRKLELPNVVDDFRFEPLGDVPVEKIRASLMAVGPSNLANKMKHIEQPVYARTPEIKRLQIRDAEQTTAKAIQGAVARHVSDGARTTNVENAKRDPRAIGYVRVLGDHPCYFCAMLASRAAPSLKHGALYRDDSFDASNKLFVGDGPAKVHDHCDCQMKPIYDRRNDPYVLKAEEYAAIWERSGAKKSGKAAVLAFRREYEGRTPTS